MAVKRITSLLIMLFLLCISMGGNAQTTETIDGKVFTLVGSADEFVKAWGARKNIKLTADINLTGRAEEMSKDSYFVNEGNGEVTKYYSVDYNGEITGTKDSYDVATDKPYYELKGIDAWIWSDICNLNMNHVIISGSSYNLFRKTTNCTFNEVLFEKCIKTNENYSVQGFISKEDEGSHFTNILFVGCHLYYESKNIGLICAQKSGGTIDNCFVTSTCVVYAQNGNVGCLVGSASNVTITNCISSATVTGYGDNMGGFVGNVEGGEIKNCSFYGIVKHSDLTANEFTQEVSSSALSLDYASFKAGKTTLSLVTLGSDYAEIYSLLCFTAGNVIDYTKGIHMLSEGITNGIIMECVQGVANIADHIATFVKGTEVVTSASTIFSVGVTLEVAWYAWGLYTLGSTLWDVLSTITGPGVVGGIAGYFGNSAKISGCSNYGMIYCVGTSCGGIIGYGKDNVKIVSCLNHGAVHGNKQTGGIVGTIDQGDVKTSFNIGSISCNNTESGGRICGQKQDAIMYYNCYSDLESDLDDDSKKGDLRVSQLDLVSGKAAAFLNKMCAGDSCWHQVVGFDHWPNLIMTHLLAKQEEIDTTLSTTVKACDQLSLISAMVNPYSDITITNDVDFDEYPAYNLSSEYMPFRGKIYGNGHHISNISFVQNGKTYTLWGLEGLWNKTQNVGILGSAKGATFSDITLENICLGTGGTSMKNASLFVANSENCTYNNIHITGNSYIGGENTQGPDVYNVGGIVGVSKNDKFYDCSIDKSCVLHVAAALTHNAYLGGIAGTADGSTFTQCWNAAKVYSNNNYIGGIVSTASNVTMTRCCNLGEVSGAADTGGLIGLMSNHSTMSYCSEDALVTGYMYEDGENVPYYSVALLVGEATDGSSLDHCLSFGSVGPTYAQNVPILGKQDSDVKVTYTYYKNSKNDLWKETSYCNIGDLYPQGTVKTDAQQETAILGGSLVGTLNEIAGDTIWYQDIDNNTFYTHYPIPIPSVGAIHKNYICSGELNYSNVYSNDTQGTHNMTLDKFGLCTICGNMGTPSKEISLNGAEDLQTLAYATNKGQDFSKSSIFLNADADMSGMTCAPIGTITHPFSAALFDGGLHHVKNLNIKTTDYAGLFGRVKNANIQYLVVDPSCTIRSTTQSAAGIVGCVSANSGEKVELFLSCCGNEATVYAPLNAAGLLGGVYNDDNISVSINNCYNAGTIIGDKESAALIGWGNKNIQMDLCYNTGVVSGYDSGHYLMRYNYDNPISITLGVLYQPEGYPDDNKAKPEFLSDSRFANGYLAGKLRAMGSPLWGQNLGTDDHPTFCRGIYHERSMKGTWGTILLPFGAQSNSSIQYYELDSFDEGNEVGNIYLKPVDHLDSNVPSLFKKLDAEATKIKVSDSDKTIPDGDATCTYSKEDANGWDIIGKYSEQESLRNVYYINDDKLCYADKSVTIPAYCAYLNPKDASGGDICKSFNILILDAEQATKIGEITADGRVTFLDKHVHNIAGQQVSKPRRGQIYIMGGKKIFVK